MKELNISQVDALFSNGIYPIEFLLYYKKAFNLKRIRSALRKLSSDFWPLFGEYGDGVISFKKYDESDCYEEEAVVQEFIIPKKEKDQLNLLSSYTLPDPSRLFHLKAIRFPNGIALIPKMNHLAGDGYSYFYCLSALAELSRSTAFSPKSSLRKILSKPHHGRTVLRDFSFKGVELKSFRQDSEFRIRFDEVRRKEVQSLIKRVSDTKNQRVSMNDMLSAMAMKKLVSAQSEFFGETVELTIPIDVRSRLREYGRKFFGNGLMLHTIELKKNDAENLQTEDLAIQIRELMPSVSKQSFVEYLARLERIISEKKWEKFRPFDPGSGCLVTNISRLPIEKLDFGSGIPELALPLTVAKHSSAIMAKNENFILRFAY
ncbi:MAG: acyltransferase [Candidatus Aminicenantes bacterium]|jgi:hypothetical protein